MGEIVILVNEKDFNEKSKSRVKYPGKQERKFYTPPPEKQTFY